MGRVGTGCGQVGWEGVELSREPVERHAAGKLSS